MSSIMLKMISQSVRLRCHFHYPSNKCVGWGEVAEGILLLVLTKPEAITTNNPNNAHNMGGAKFAHDDSRCITLQKYCFYYDGSGPSSPPHFGSLATTLRRSLGLN